MWTPFLQKPGNLPTIPRHDMQSKTICHKNWNRIIKNTKRKCMPLKILNQSGSSVLSKRGSYVENKISDPHFEQQYQNVWTLTLESDGVMELKEKDTDTAPLK